jgi:MerR family transcriptional regulator, copper efflux regulator
MLNLVRISQLAGQAGVTSKTLRYYERIGLLPAPSRSPSGYRDYRPDVLDRLGFIRAGQAVGLSLGEIRQVVALRDRGDTPCDHVFRLLQRRTAELNERIDELQGLKRELQALTTRARRLDPADCSPGGVCHLIASGVGGRDTETDSPTPLTQVRGGP